MYVVEVEKAGGDVFAVSVAVPDDEHADATIDAILSIDGTQYRTTEAPRLSVFRSDGRRWRMVSHANFNVPA